MSVCINSDSKINIEDHFRISAGPGAGKTFWLIKHVKNVLHASQRLSKARKIACITYTNVGVEAILKNLGSSTEQVEVSTIHSFLYKHIVKPYCSFLPPEIKLNINKFDGHYDTVINFKKVSEWIDNHPQKSKLKPPYSIKQLIRLPTRKTALVNWLSTLGYKFDNFDRLEIKGDRAKAYCSEATGKRYFLPRICLNILESGLLEYKNLYWESGIVDHNDILYFSYVLVARNPFILHILRAKFPYFFVDEFQDTNPIQTKLLNKLGQSETIVGIIGDKAQSIYSFQGATPDQFGEFSLSTNIKDYIMIDNRRSTNQIITVLNHVRSDFIQSGCRNVDGDVPVIMIGERNRAYDKAKELSNGEDVYSLSRRNITSNAMKKEFEDEDLNQKLIDELMESDGNAYRYNMIISCIKSIELAKYGKYKDAIKELEYLFHRDNKADTRRLILDHLTLLLNNYGRFENGSLMLFYEFVKNNVSNSLSGFRAGKAKTFYENHLYKELAICTNIVDDRSNHKTIHKAKGDEFNNVIVILTDESDLNFLLDPNLESKEEQRIYYVAISRAKEKLFINVPSLSKINKERLKTFLKIIEV